MCEYMVQHEGTWLSPRRYANLFNIPRGVAWNKTEAK